MDFLEMTPSARVARVAVELDELVVQYHAAASMPHTTDVEWFARTWRLALVCAREAAWWRVLRRVLREERGVSLVVCRAVVIAEHKRRGDARFWRDSAAEWLARVEGRPTSDAAGALSNWRELGVAS